MRAHRRKDNKQLSLERMMIKKQGQLLGIKRTNKKEEHRELASYYTKLLEDGLMQDVVKCVCHIHLQHHPIGMDIQSSLNTLHHHLTPTPNYHAKLMMQQMRKKHIMELKT
jgi:hypothetical protein